MDVFICDNELNVIRVVDSYSSVIWTERYSSCGDFQLDLPYDEELFHILTDDSGLEDDYRARIKGSNTVMMIEEVTLITDAEEGVSMTIKGRSLEAILERRVIYGQTEVLSDLETNIHQIINNNAVEPEDQNRIIPGLVIAESGDDRITEITFEAQYYFDNLYNKIQEICETYSVGFRIWPIVGGVEFKLFMGEDRSFGQEDNNFVIFSPRFDNLLNSNYVEAVSEMSNVAYTVGEGERSQTEIGESSRDGVTYIGLKRRELAVDAGDVSKTVDNGDGRQRHLTDEEYKTELGNAGLEELANYEYKRTFDGEVDSSLTFKYGIDYFIGDLVEVENEYGMSAKAKVTELIRSYDSNGYKEYPTFEKIEV